MKNSIIKEIKVRPATFQSRKGEMKKDSVKIYIFHEGETIIDNLVNRRSRPQDDYREYVIPEIMKILENVNPTLFAEIKDKKLAWSQNCGCKTCPCSPGFIIDIYNPTDIYVTI